MKKRSLRSVLTLALCAALLLALPVHAAEEEPKPLVSAPMLVWGTLSPMGEKSFQIKNQNEAIPTEEFILHTGDRTRCLDAVTGDPVALSELKEDTLAYVYISPAMTASLPPQTSAVLILTNIPADFRVPSYHEVVTAVAGEKSVTVTTDQGVTFTVDETVTMFPHLIKKMVGLGDLMPGAQMLVWNGNGKEITKIMIFAYSYRGYLELNAEGQMTVSGETLETPVKKDAEGTVLVPIRAVTEKLMGIDVTWDNGVVVSAAGTRLFTVKPGATEAVTGDGETQTLTGTCVIENGVTYLPARDLANLLNLFWMPQ